MGLAEPRKRVKLSHDPRNLSWSQSSSSFGQRLMTKQGWKEGQSLGNRDSVHLGLNDVDRLAAARVGVLFKDNNLGLGAKTKGRDVEAQRHGLDAFQGLLGRLNGKSDAELQKVEKKIEDRKLEMYARGRWGGMVFVRGGVLVGSLEDKEREDKQVEPENAPKSEEKDESHTEERRMKEEKRQRKEERRKRREEKAARKLAKEARKSAAMEESATVTSKQPPSVRRSPTTQPPDEAVSSASSENEVERASAASSLKRKLSSDGHQGLVASKSQVIATTKTRNGRHLLRGRNIEAKRMAFSNMKGLDEIFMRPG
ncbi:Pin2-interacting protein X1 [Exophiala viscosa]|uniref:Pin2-interacting protein X1 n=1 Tax=Exophiala viscosa TaxID=2486360 RepID=A0AAN6DZV0_9EURO|nr:Pin2-interacting protein X1 [Exophiala viscosa]